MKTLVRYFLVVVMCGVVFYQVNTSEPQAKRLKEGDDIYLRNIMDIDFGEKDSYEKNDSNGVTDIGEIIPVTLLEELVEISSEVLEAQVEHGPELQENSFSVGDYIAAKEVPLKMNVLDFSNQRLTSLSGLEKIPEKIRNRVYTLDLRGNFIKSILDGIFSCFTNLEFIFLQNNCLEELNKESFGRLPYVRVLDISNNRIAKADREVFFGLKHLEELHAENAFANTVPHDIFNYNPNLKILNIANNGLNFPPNMKNLKQLQKFYGHNNKFDSFSSELMPRSTDWKIFNIAGNRLQKDTLARLIAFICALAIVNPAIIIINNSINDEELHMLFKVKDSLQKCLPGREF